MAVNRIGYFRDLARYNTWMNRRIYEVCGCLTDEERKRDMGAFFRSIHGTLNHLLLTDRVQLGRFIGPERVRSFDSAGAEIEIRSLDQRLYDSFEDLARERARTDALIEEWTGKELTEDFLEGSLRYQAMSAAGEFLVPMFIAVAHFFNHQTHHRGQITTLLSQLGRDPGVTDLMAMLRQRVV
jgi:uncharacterized damage-inducible protein DinB